MKQGKEWRKLDLSNTKSTMFGINGMFIILVSEPLKLFFILKDQQFMNGTAPNLADRKELQGVVQNETWVGTKKLY